MPRTVLLLKYINYHSTEKREIYCLIIILKVGKIYEKVIMKISKWIENNCNVSGAKMLQFRSARKKSSVSIVQLRWANQYFNWFRMLHTTQGISNQNRPARFTQLSKQCQNRLDTQTLHIKLKMRKSHLFLISSEFFAKSFEQLIQNFIPFMLWLCSESIFIFYAFPASPILIFEFSLIAQEYSSLCIAQVLVREIACTLHCYAPRI